MSFLLLMLLIGFGGAALLAASPFLVYLISKNIFDKWANPYEKAYKSIESFNHPTKSFLADFSKSNLAQLWLQPANFRLSIGTKALLLSTFPKAQRMIYIKALPASIRNELDAYFKKNKKAKTSQFDEAQREIDHLLREELKQNKKNTEALMFSQYHELYDSIQTIHSLKEKTNRVLQMQITEIINRSLELFPFFKEHQLFEIDHKFKTLLQKDIIEFLHLIGTMDGSQKIDREAELYSIFKGILREIEEIEEISLNHADGALSQKMRVMKQKFKVELDEE